MKKKDSNEVEYILWTSDKNRANVLLDRFFYFNERLSVSLTAAVEFRNMTEKEKASIKCPRSCSKGIFAWIIFKGKSFEVGERFYKKTRYYNCVFLPKNK